MTTIITVATNKTESQDTPRPNTSVNRWIAPIIAWYTFPLSEDHMEILFAQVYRLLIIDGKWRNVFSCSYIRLDLFRKFTKVLNNLVDKLKGLGEKT